MAHVNVVLDGEIGMGQPRQQPSHRGDISPAWLHYPLTFLVPVGLATTIPAEAIVGGLNAETLSASVALAAGLLALSRWLWLAGLRHYAGASA